LSCHGLRLDGPETPHRVSHGFVSRHRARQSAAWRIAVHFARCAYERRRANPGQAGRSVERKVNKSSLTPSLPRVFHDPESSKSDPESSRRAVVDLCCVGNESGGSSAWATPVSYPSPYRSCFPRPLSCLPLPGPMGPPFISSLTLEPGPATALKCLPLYFGPSAV